MAEGRGGSRWTQGQLEQGATGIFDASLHYGHDRPTDSWALTLAGAVLDAVFPVGEPDDERLVEEFEKVLASEGVTFSSRLPITRRQRQKFIHGVARAAVAAVRAIGTPET